MLPHAPYVQVFFNILTFMLRANCGRPSFCNRGGCSGGEDFPITLTYSLSLVADVPGICCNACVWPDKLSFAGKLEMGDGFFIEL